jgi:ankyrin repeat protein
MLKTQEMRPGLTAVRNALLALIMMVPLDVVAQPVPMVRDNVMVEAARRGDIAGLEAAHANGMKANRLGVNGLSPLHVAAQFGRTEAVAKLLTMTGKIDHRDRDRQTALGHSVVYGHSESAALLLAAGADPNRSGPNYEPPLVVAARQGNLDIVTALLAAGADTSLGDNTGRTALEWARLMRHLDIITALEAR